MMVATRLRLINLMNWVCMSNHSLGRSRMFKIARIIVSKREKNTPRSCVLSRVANMDLEKWA